MNKLVIEIAGYGNKCRITFQKDHYMYNYFLSNYGSGSYISREKLLEELLYCNHVSVKQWFRCFVADLEPGTKLKFKLSCETEQNES